MWSFKDWRRRRIIHRSPYKNTDWAQLWAGLPVLERLRPEERARLRDLSLLFLHYKSLEPVRGLELDVRQGLVIALQACLPVLNLGLDWLGGWTSIIVYPESFAVDHEETDEAGIVHRVRRALSGESWQRGPLILSWDDVVMGLPRDGHNVIIHEVAHKLDSLNGAADGFPPLHREMSIKAWTDAFTEAYENLNARLDAGEPAPIDPYGAASPAEFFAVTTEFFFERPDILGSAYPRVHALLKQFYRQEP